MLHARALCHHLAAAGHPLIEQSPECLRESFVRPYETEHRVAPKRGDLSEDNDGLVSWALDRGSYRYWCRSIVGRMFVEYRDLGAVTVVNLGEINRGVVLRSKELDQNFRTIGSTDHDQYGGLQCGENTCDVVVLRKQLRMH